MEDKTKEIPLIEVQKLSFSYGKLQVLKEVSFRIESGGITTIMGANGSGKSTLFSLLTRNMYPDQGRILLNGVRLQKLHRIALARQIAIVHQNNVCDEDITVERLVAFGRTPHMKLFSGKSKEDEKMIGWALQVTGLVPYKEREVSKLSGGQRQRVWIAMALAQNTRVLLLDEPTTFLDIRYQLEILELIRQLNKQYGITIVMVLHDINQAIRYSDRIIGLKDGRIVASGAPEEIITPEMLLELYGVSLGVHRVEGRCIVLTA